MNKKGFTLIELLSVIIILSLLMILVLPKITDSVRNNSKKTDALMLEMIETAAKLYIEDNIDSLEENEYGYYCVPLTELVNNNYLKEGIELSGKDATYTKSLRINYNEDNKIEIVDSNKCLTNSESGDSQSPVLAAGLYDSNDVLLATWDELVKAGLDVEMELDSSTNSTNKDILNSYGDSYKLIIDDSITEIGDFAFYYCSSLVSVTIPSSVTSIGHQAFNSTRLESITIPESVTSIGHQAFAFTGLESITIPESVTSIGNNPFTSCVNLVNIVVDENNNVYDSRDNSSAIIETASNKLITGCQNTVIPNSVTSIGDSAFMNFTNLTSIIIPSSVTSIGTAVFYGTGLESITIPSSVTSIGNNSFTSCVKLVNIVVDENNNVYDSRDNSNAIIETASNTLIAGCQNTIIPNSLTSIGNSAFMGCTSLTSIAIPSGVTSIGSQAFASTGLESITIPSSVTSIGNSVFTSCNKLTAIYYSGTATGSPWGAPNAEVISE